jgi:hypothetical protein
VIVLDNKLLVIAIALLFTSPSFAGIVYINDTTGVITDPSVTENIQEVQASNSRMELLLLETKTQISALNSTIGSNQEANKREIIDSFDTSLMAARDDLIVVIDDKTNPIRVIPPIVGFNIALLAIVIFIWSAFKARSKLLENGKDVHIKALEAENTEMSVQLELLQADKPKKGIKFMSKKELEAWNTKKLLAKKKEVAKKEGIVGKLLKLVPFVGGKKKGGNSNGDGHRENEAGSHKDGHVENAARASSPSTERDRFSGGQIREAVLGEGEAYGKAVSHAVGPEAQLKPRNDRSHKVSDRPLIKNMSKTQLKEMTKAELIEMYRHLEG